jgi:hypothetical protein
LIAATNMPFRDGQTPSVAQREIPAQHSAASFIGASSSRRTRF